MSVGLLLIGHKGVGEGLLSAVRSICPDSEVLVENVSIAHEDKPEHVLDSIGEKLSQLDQGSGVLILSDLYGSTPSNIATQFYQPGKVAVVLGMNLPMLIRIFNYATQSLDELAKKAVEGGNRGIFLFSRDIQGKQVEK